MQTKEVCDTRRMLEQRLDILRAQHDEAYAYLCHIEEKFQDTTSEFYQGAYAMYKSAEQARTKAEAATEYERTLLTQMLPTTPNRWSHTTLRSLNKLRPINTTTISTKRIKPDIQIQKTSMMPSS
ncbi:hypothetical protein NPIL_459671 [Nephila pilipes]|uniref:Uncharacterized protein n=1 Tax=Nephila pilipes TaxID=299642 RepID=A0A8X6QX22_NEPPI|nr:hypothetical protein NPIL_459671 [Nephila pilipes]